MRHAYFMTTCQSFKNNQKRAGMDGERTFKLMGRVFISRCLPRHCIYALFIFVFIYFVIIPFIINMSILKNIKLYVFGADECRTAANNFDWRLCICNGFWLLKKGFSLNLKGRYFIDEKMNLFIFKYIQKLNKIILSFFGYTKCLCYLIFWLLFKRINQECTLNLIYKYNSF